MTDKATVMRLTNLRRSEGIDISASLRNLLMEGVAMTGVKAPNFADQPYRNYKAQPPSVWIKPDLSDFRVKAGSYMIDEYSGYLTGDISLELAHFSDSPENLQALKDYSRYVLSRMIFGKNDTSKSSFLREIYWRTIEILANSR